MTALNVDELLLIYKVLAVLAASAVFVWAVCCAAANAKARRREEWIPPGSVSVTDWMKVSRNIQPPADPRVRDKEIHRLIRGGRVH